MLYERKPKPGTSSEEIPQPNKENPGPLLNTVFRKRDPLSPQEAKRPDGLEEASPRLVSDAELHSAIDKRVEEMLRQQEVKNEARRRSSLPVKDNQEPREDTPLESRSKLRALVETFKEIKDKTSERATSLGKFLGERSKVIGASLQKLGVDTFAELKSDAITVKNTAMYAAAFPGFFIMEKSKSAKERATKCYQYFRDENKSGTEKFKGLIEGYNKLSPVKKFYITAGLVVGSSAASALAIPALPTILTGGIYLARGFGTVGFGFNRRKGMDAHIAKDPEHWLANKSDTFKNTYAVALAAMYGATTLGASLGGRFLLKQWFGSHPLFNHDTKISSAHPANNLSASMVPPHDIPPAVTATTGEAVNVVTPIVPETPTVEMPSVEVSKGRGYEDMVERLWKQLQEKHLDPTAYAKGSDIRQLLEADSTSVHKVAYDIARDHKFLLPNGDSVRIDPGTHITIDDNGQINRLTSNGSDTIYAPDNSPVTHGYQQPEAPHAIPAQPEQSLPDHEVAETPAVENTLPSTTPEPSAAPADLQRLGVSHEDAVQSGGDLSSPGSGIDTPTGGSTPASATPEAPTDLTKLSPQEPKPYDMTHQIQANHFGLRIHLAEAHVYLSPKGEALVYGGRFMEQKSKILEYLTAHPKDTVYGADITLTYRVPYTLIDGKPVPGEALKKHGFLSHFQRSRWVPLPVADDLKKLIQ
jgi:hypothetical protein